jgi:hypothetical protein
MDLHRGDETRIMYLYTGDPEHEHKPAPFGVEGRDLRQDWKKALQQSKHPICISRRQAQTIPVYRPGGHVPALGTILRGNVQRLSRAAKRPHGGANHRVERISAV